jgi:hypothetical protein
LKGDDDEHFIEESAALGSALEKGLGSPKRSYRFSGVYRIEVRTHFRHRFKTKGIKRTKTTGVNKKNKPAKKRLAKKAGGKGLPKSGPKTKVQKIKKSPEALAVYLKTPGAPSGRQSGDLQQLSTDQSADSESVTELLEEGNPLEAGVVSGVEAAESDESEVRTHQRPQDDVPSEYLDEVQRRYR